MELAILNSLDQLRINDLIAKIAHVRAKDTIRVLLALQAVSKEYDLSLDELVQQPRSTDRPTLLQSEECNRAYRWMHYNKRLNRYLSEMERFA